MKKCTFLLLVLFVNAGLWAQPFSKMNFRDQPIQKGQQPPTGDPNTENEVMPQSGNLLINSSFEEGPNVGSFVTLRAGETIPGWQVVRETIDLNNTYMDAADGQRCIDLNGTPGIGAIEQRFFTEAGQEYRLSFYMAGNPNGPPAIKKMRVTAGDQSLIFDFDITGKSNDKMGWERKEMSFRATDRKTALVFESLPDYYTSNNGPALDLVEVKAKGSKSVSSRRKDSGLFGFHVGLLGGTSYYFVHKGDILSLYNGNQLKYKLNIQDADFGFHFGFFAEGRVGPLFLRPELYVNSNEINFQVEDLQQAAGDFIARERYQYLDMPLLIGYKMGLFKFFGGPVGHLFIANQSDLRDLANFSADFKKLTLGYQGGIGVAFHPVMLDIRFEGNMSKIGSGLLYNGQKIYFSKHPARLMATLSFAIW